MKTATLPQAYEIRNPSFSDLTLDQQIAVGVNDWCAEDHNGHPYYGTSKLQAEQIRTSYTRPNFVHDPVGFVRSI